jgi:heme exporter protein A
MPAVLTFDCLTPLRCDIPLIQVISGCLCAGEMLEITGQNGIGKSSLLDVFAGHLPTYSGRYKWSHLTHKPLYIKPKAPLDEEASVLENLAFLSALYQSTHKHINEHLKTALKSLMLDKIADIPVQYLSSGQKQRVNLAQLILGSSAQVWLLDEPFTALDQNGTAMLCALMQAHLKKQGIIIHATHAPLGWGTTLSLKLPDLTLEQSKMTLDFNQSSAV